MSEKITLQLLQQILNRNGENIEYNVKGTLQKGNNYTTGISSVAVVTARGDTIHLIAKLMPDNEQRLALMKHMQMLEKEIASYTSILPAIVDFQHRRGVIDLYRPPVPKLYDVVDPDVLFFEDLTKRGYRMESKLDGLDYSHCRLVVKELAKMHAMSLAVADDAQKSLSELYPLLKPRKSSSKSTYVKAHQLACDAVEKLDPDLAARMRNAKGLDMDKAKEEMTLDEQCIVMCHGDCWVNNIMFKYDKDDDVPVSLKFLDFQLVTACAPTLDLTYFFLTSSTSAVRQQHLDDLLTLYQSTFHSTLSEVNIPLPQGLTAESLKQMYRRDLAFGYLRCCLVLPLILAEPDEAVDFDDLQYNGTSASFGRSILEDAVNKRQTDRFPRRIYDIAQDLDRIGFFDK